MRCESFWISVQMCATSPSIKEYLCWWGTERESISTMSVDVQSLSIDTPVVALWSDDPTYAEYLTSTFEIVWEQSVPAAQRIEEL